MQPQVITRDEVVAAPLEIPLGAADAFEPLSAFASFDGTAAAGAFLPTITYYSQDGKVLARAFPADEVAAGESADVSWFPGLAVSPAAVVQPGSGPGKLLYYYVVAGADKAAIDTATDGVFAGSFPSTYNVLECWMLVRTTDAVASTHDVNVTVNGDTAAHYSGNWIYGLGGTPFANFNYNTTHWLFDAEGASTAANSASLISFTIPFYALTGFFKVGYQSEDIPDNAGNVETLRQSLVWKQTAAIASIAVAAQGAAKLKVGSALMVYAR